MSFLPLLVVLCLAAVPHFAHGQLHFTEQSTTIGLTHVYRAALGMGSGVVVFDYNNDDYLDLFFPGGDGGDYLYENAKDGTFRNVSFAAGLYRLSGVVTNGAVSGDFDNDGDADLFVTTLAGRGSVLWQNNGDATFSEIGIGNFPHRDTAEQFNGFSPVATDVNGDGLLDVYVPRWIGTPQLVRDSSGALTGFAHHCAANELWINQGNLSFAEEGFLRGVANRGCGLAAAASDVDLDGAPDLLVVNDFGAYVAPDSYLRNDGSGRFSTPPASGFGSEIYGMGIAVGDYDQDGDLDYYKTNIGPNVLLTNGPAGFSDAARDAGVLDDFDVSAGGDSTFRVGWGAGFTDLDNDTDLDLVIANGRIGDPRFFPALDSLTNRLYLNIDGQGFADATAQTAFNHYGNSRGLAYADLDNDGDQDVVVTNQPNLRIGLPARPVVMRNQLASQDLAASNSLQIKLRGIQSNRDGLGALIRVVVGDKSWVHEVGGGGQGHNSQHAYRAFFGLGAADAIDTLTVIWPHGASPPQSFTNVLAGGLVEITEASATLRRVFQTSSFAPARTRVDAPRVVAVPNPTPHSVSIQVPQRYTGAVQWSLFTLTGKPVSNQRETVLATTGSAFTVQLPKAGSYLLSLQWGQHNETLRLVRF